MWSTSTRVLVNESKRSRGFDEEEDQAKRNYVIPEIIWEVTKKSKQGCQRAPERAWDREHRFTCGIPSAQQSVWLRSCSATQKGPRNANGTEREQPASPEENLPRRMGGIWSWPQWETRRGGSPRRKPQQFAGDSWSSAGSTCQGGKARRDVIKSLSLGNAEQGLKAESRGHMGR